MHRLFSKGLLDLLFPPRCLFCGHPLEEELWKPCPKCRNAPFWTRGQEALRPGEVFSVCVCAGWYQDALRDSVLRFKFSNHPEYARAYGPLLAEEIKKHLAGQWDLLSWMPVSPETRQTRGYDQARLLAEETAACLGCYAVPLLEKVGHNVPQSSLSDGSQRRKNVEGMYRAVKSDKLAGARVLLVDDIVTTGSTLSEGAAVLRQAGAARVLAAAFCRTPPSERASSP